MPKRTKLRDAFFGGLLGSAIFTGALMVLLAIGALTGSTAFYVMSEEWVGAAVVGVVLCALADALWALPFAVFVPDPTVGKAIAFGLIPALWNWGFLPILFTDGPLLGVFPPFASIVLLVSNALVWGSIVGWCCARRARL